MAAEVSARAEPAAREEYKPEKGDWIEHAKFGLCKIEGLSGDGVCIIKLPDARRKKIKIDATAGALRPRSDGGTARLSGSRPQARKRLSSSSRIPRVASAAHCDVRQQVADLNRDAEHQHDRHDDGRIERFNRLDRQEPEARPGEDLLGDDRAADEERQAQADQGDDGEEGVADGVLDDHSAHRHALGFRGSHVVVPQRFDELSTHDPCIRRGARDGQDQEGSSA